MKTAQQRALNNAKSFVNPEKSLPENVFSGHWATFLFFESDRLFVADFIDIVKELIVLEGATVCCLLNLNETNSPEAMAPSALFLDESTVGIDYLICLRGSGPAVGWIYSMDRYGCASDIGEWCIYCEKENDIAVIGFHRKDGLLKYRMPIDRLRAKNIAVACDRLNDMFPFNQLTPGWLTGLTENYGKTAN